MTSRIAARLSLTLLTLWLCGCGESPQKILVEANDLHDKNNLDGAIALVDKGLLTANEKSPIYWQLYLLRVQSLQQRDGSGVALQLLQKEPPALPELAEVRLRYKIQKAYSETATAEYEAAEKDLNEAASLARSFDSKILFARLEFQQAFLYTRLKRFDEAESKMRDAYSKSVELNDVNEQGYALATLGNLLFAEGRLEEALRTYEQQFDLLKTSPEKNRSKLAATTVALASVWDRLGDSEKTLQLWQQAASLGRLSGDTATVAQAMGGMGFQYKDRGEYANARTYLQQAVSMSSKMYDPMIASHWLSGLAEISVILKDWDSAERYNQQALALKRKTKDEDSELNSLVISGQILEGRGRIPEAEALFRRVAAASSHHPEPTLSAHAALAKLYSRTGKEHQAEQEFQAAADVLEDARSDLESDEVKLKFLESLVQVDQEYLDFLMSTGKTEQALEVSEFGRARVLQERVNASGLARRVTAADYRAMARQSNAVILSYRTGVKRSYVWLITPDRILAYPVPPDARLRSLVEKYRAIIENMRDPLELEDGTGRELYDVLLAPVADRIPAGSRVVVVPDGPLTALNLETLPVPSGSPHYFLRDATVMVVPSLNLLARREESKPLAGSLLLIGDPDYRGDQYQKLPFGSREINSVRGHFDANRTTTYLGEKAVPAIYAKAGPSRFQFIHFTAHATADPRSPLESAVILAGPNSSNKLTARDVLLSPLDAALVTISACRGAGAKTYGGEGLVGFTWAFFQAGAQNIVAGLWDVSDESTPFLMDRLYTGLKEGEVPAKALQMAKLELIRSNAWYRAPYFWGPFQLYVREARSAGHPL